MQAWVLDNGQQNLGYQGITPGQYRTGPVLIFCNKGTRGDTC